MGLQVKALGEMFPVEGEALDVKSPRPFDESLAITLERESKARMAQERKQNSARNYRKLFTRLTSKQLSTDMLVRFEVLEETFGKTSVQEVVEYIAIKHPNNWAVEGFFSYLLKALQGNAKNNSQKFTERSPEDEYIAKLDRYIRRQTRKAMREARSWNKNDNMLR